MDLDDGALAFLTERHLGALATVRPDGSPHVVPVGFAYDADAGVVRIITQAGSRKARHAAAGGRASVMQVDGRRWLTLEGTVSLVTDPVEVDRAARAYAERYQPPTTARAATRVAVEIAVDRVMGRP